MIWASLDAVIYLCTFPFELSVYHRYFEATRTSPKRKKSITDNESIFCLSVMTFCVVQKPTVQNTFLSGTWILSSIDLKLMNFFITWSCISALSALHLIIVVLNFFLHIPGINTQCCACVYRTLSQSDIGHEKVKDPTEQLFWIVVHFPI